MTILRKPKRLAFVAVLLASMLAAALAPMASAAAAISSDLTPNEVTDLQYMREEEKLARDVYLSLDEAWNLQVFANIAQSEQTHMDAVLTLLERYGIDDPAAGAAMGEFTNPDLQELYDDLVAQGSESLADALRVGAAIEEIDIADLIETIAGTDHADILRVYQSLQSGSENHLRAFVRTLERLTGESYEPQYLDQATYDEIMAGAAGNGRGPGRPGRPGRPW